MPDQENMRNSQQRIPNRSWLMYPCSIVETATTVVCPYATVSTQSGGVVTSLLQTTTYVRTTHSLQRTLMPQPKSYGHEVVARLSNVRG